MRYKIWIWTGWCSIAALFASCNGSDYPGVQELVDRRVPWLADKVVFQQKQTPDNEFTLREKNGKLLIEASSPNTAAVGLNWYLKYYCHRSMSHMGDMLEPVDELPLPSTPQTVRTGMKYRYALNYCTFNYSMSFYSWEDWERELDWMALHGVNLMLVANGAEAVWQNTLRRFGYSDDEIASFITGPAYNAWWLMGNIEEWGGPMPQSQIDDRQQTVRKMISRMRELGIEPLMPGFYGMVPDNFGEHTGAKVFDQGSWGALVRPALLDPTGPDFERVASVFYEETKRIYGDDIRFFSGDPFHEGGNIAGVDLAAAGLAIQKAMHKEFPDAVWVLQGWQDNPKPKLLEKLDRSQVLVQELFGENTANWEARKAYEGTPFIWATVTNFGERPGVNGKLQRFADEVYRAATGDFAQYMKGVGILPEGICNNPVAYDLVLELPWHENRIQVSEWIQDYVASRYGKRDPRIDEAWQIFLQTIYDSNIGYQEGPPENILCARPAFEIRSVSSWGRLAKKYDHERFAEGVRILASAYRDFKSSETYRIDLINMLRQIIAIQADTVFSELMAAYEKSDRPTFESEVKKFLSLHDLENDLLAQHPIFRVDTYQKQALDAGNTPAESDNNLYNLMMLITFWGGNDPSDDNLHDYAYKEWAGMMNSYYKERWVLWFDYLKDKLDGKNPEPPEYFYWEREWSEDNRRIIESASEASLEEILAEMGYGDPDRSNPQNTEISKP